LHFGLGQTQTADLEIRWPSGVQEKISGVAADRLVVIREGAGVIRAETWPHAH
jgi:enediyne biosynthesis protein E4